MPHRYNEKASTSQKYARSPLADIGFNYSSSIASDADIATPDHNKNVSYVAKQSGGDGVRNKGSNGLKKQNIVTRIIENAVMHAISPAGNRTGSGYASLRANAHKGRNLPPSSTQQENENRQSAESGRKAADKAGSDGRHDQNRGTRDAYNDEMRHFSTDIIDVAANRFAANVHALEDSSAAFNIRTMPSDRSDAKSEDLNRSVWSIDSNGLPTLSDEQRADAGKAGNTAPDRVHQKKSEPLSKMDPPATENAPPAPATNSKRQRDSGYGSTSSSGSGTSSPEPETGAEPFPVRDSGAAGSSAQQDVAPTPNSAPAARRREPRQRRPPTDVGRAQAEARAQASGGVDAVPQPAAKLPRQVAAQGARPKKPAKIDKLDEVQKYVNSLNNGISIETVDTGKGGSIKVLTGTKKRLPREKRLPALAVPVGLSTAMLYGYKKGIEMQTSVNDDLSKIVISSNKAETNDQMRSEVPNHGALKAKLDEVVDGARQSRSKTTSRQPINRGWATSIRTECSTSSTSIYREIPRKKSATSSSKRCDTCKILKI